MSYRGQHYLDVPTDASGRKRVRTVANWISYRTSDGVWRATNNRIRGADAGEDFQGIPIQFVAERQPLQAFLGAPAALGGRPWWGIRRSEREDVGVLWFLESGESTGRTVDIPTRTVTYPACLPGTDLALTFGASRVEKWLTLASSVSGEGGSGDRVTLGALLPVGWSLAVIDEGQPGNRIEIRRPNASVAYLSHPAQALDADDVQVPCTFITPASPTGTLAGRTYWRVRVRCAPGSAAYPVRMDPTVTINNPAAISDFKVNGSTSANYNYGGEQTHTVRGAASWSRVVYKLESSYIPTGTGIAFGACTMNLVIVGGNPTNTKDIYIHRITDANVWTTAGTANGSSQAGSPCWNYRIYNTNAWAGSAGILTSGGDYDATQLDMKTIPVSPASGGNDKDVTQFSIPGSLVLAWGPGGAVNNGLLLYTSNLTASNFPYGGSAVVDTSYRPSFTLPYTVATAPGAYPLGSVLAPSLRPWLDPR